MPNNDSENHIYIFRENMLVVPEDTPDSDSIYGVEAPLIPAQWKGSEYVAIPALEYSLDRERPHSPAIAAYILGDQEDLPQGWKTIPVRSAMSMLTLLNSGNPLVGLETDGEAAEKPDGNSRIMAGRLFRAFHVIQWQRNSRYCGSCGTPNGYAHHELARLCPACGRVEFPRITPAVIVLITNEEDKILLAHNARFSGNTYSLIAGFNEAGENLEATVTREIVEEVGVQVRDIRYVASQPWPFPYSLMIGFTARHSGGLIVPDGVEISDARWFSRDDLPELPGLGSIARFLINAWVEGRLAVSG